MRPSPGGASSSPLVSPAPRRTVPRPTPLRNDGARAAVEGQAAAYRADTPEEWSDRMARLSGKTVGVFVAEGFEDLEFWVPVMRLQEEGARTLVIGLTREPVTAKHCLTATPDT